MQQCGFGIIMVIEYIATLVWENAILNLIVITYLVEKYSKVQGHLKMLINIVNTFFLLKMEIFWKKSKIKIGFLGLERLIKINEFYLKQLFKIFIDLPLEMMRNQLKKTLKLYKFKENRLNFQKDYVSSISLLNYLRDLFWNLFFTAAGEIDFLLVWTE